MSIHRRSVEQFDNLYFAYGSNLHLAQMDLRCPSSIFIGKGVLYNYRWQINERGVANVVRSDRDHVEGLLFSITRKDERVLDRSEGISRGFYEKLRLAIRFEPVANNEYIGCKTSYMARMLETGIPESQEHITEGATPPTLPFPRDTDNSHKTQNSTGDIHPRVDVSKSFSGSCKSDACSAQPNFHGSERSGSRDPCVQGMSQQLRSVQDEIIRSTQPSAARKNDVQEAATGSKPIEALVYISQRYKRDGNIREEYVPRMEKAMADALNLGVSEHFMKTTIVPFVRGPTMRSNKPNPPDERRDGSKGSEDESSDKAKRLEKKSRKRPRDNVSGIKPRGNGELGEPLVGGVGNAARMRTWSDETPRNQSNSWEWPTAMLSQLFRRDPPG